MQNRYANVMNTERSVEIKFMVEILNNLNVQNPNLTYLEVGGIPSKRPDYAEIYSTIQTNKLNYEICDFRGGKYQGDFVTYDFGNDKFDVIIFLSSLEHFPQCTEGDMKFRKDEDIRGFEKSLSLLNPGGKILMTVPFGAPVWQDYHQNYDMERIDLLSVGSNILEQYIFKLIGNVWTLTPFQEMDEVFYTDKCYGVGCFVFEKNDN